METSYEHVPVMCEEVVTLLAPAVAGPDAVMVDATLGLGGHAQALLDGFPSLNLIGLDRDPQAIKVAKTRLAGFADRLEVHESTYDRIGVILGSRRADAVLFDLGLSSLQIDSPERGFSYASGSSPEQDGPEGLDPTTVENLSMRMDGDPTKLTAADVVNTYSVEDLSHIFRVYADEQHATRIARAIVAARDVEAISTSARLAAVVSAAVPVTRGRTGHPAKRVFQALRIEVNDERRSMEEALLAAMNLLRVNGRIAVLSYHSGEDRFVKQRFADACSDHVPPGLAVVPEARRARFRPVTRGALKPSQVEVTSNPRARSARLRAVERLKEEA
ncbi:MAG: 16S rRNA (cytosine(1402)-N(4))-methyltransferase RsmH [Propionibacteriaceae bacterium]|nr:16S rRNA (cytosine(1402)-N(4))-methyltransferase RsmH [Propionibacteriaceae bacterium]